MAEHGLKIRVIKQVSEGTKDIICARCKTRNLTKELMDSKALALLHGDVCDLIYASDLAQKEADTIVFEIGGSCPQHLTCIGILGDVSAVEEAVKRIEEEML